MYVRIFHMLFLESQRPIPTATCSKATSILTCSKATSILRLKFILRLQVHHQSMLHDTNDVGGVRGSQV